MDERGAILDAVADSLGFTIVDSRVIQIEPGISGLVSGHAVEWVDENGIRSTESVYLESELGDREREAGAIRSDRPGVMTLVDDAGETVSAWLYPADPALPTLPSAVFAGAASVLLDRLGLESSDLMLTVIAYRPGKRAVIRMITTTHERYLKVVRPTAAAAIVERHRSWRDAGLVAPEIVGWSPDGLIAMDPLDGVEMSTVLDSLEPRIFVDVIESLTHRIAAVKSGTPARPSLLSKLEWYESRVSDGRPDIDHTVVTSICHEIDRLARASEDPGPAVTIHGDLHVGQIFVDANDPSAITGILDIDTAGWGDPADDAAALWAHLVATAEHRRACGGAESARGLDALASAARARWVDLGFARRASAIAAVHLLGHVLSTAISLEVASKLIHQLVDELTTT